MASHVILGHPVTFKLVIKLNDTSAWYDDWNL